MVPLLESGCQSDATAGQARELTAAGASRL
jgi:hypothetical protein